CTGGAERRCDGRAGRHHPGGAERDPHRPEQLDGQPRRDVGTVQRHHQQHQRARASPHRSRGTVGGRRLARRAHRGHRRIRDVTAGRDGTGGARRGEQGPQEHRPLVPSTLPVPEPPVAEGTGLPWDIPVDDAVAAIAAARARHGDTFAVDSGNDHYLFTFSPMGVESFYALPEDAASKGLADLLMLRRKLPDEIFAGRRILPTSLFRRDDVASYLANLDRALDHTVTELGSEGTVDLFDLTRRLGHRMGLASWAGAGAAYGAAFERLVVA